ncbi:MAG: alpha/beta hydrolase [Albidovulum sp.]
MRYDEAFANGKYIRGGAEYPKRWQLRADAFRRDLGERAVLGVAYGKGARQWFDLFVPEVPPLGLLIFVHGGYWLDFGPRDFSHLAAGALARGWTVAMPGYSLAPGARISEITAEVALALGVMAQKVEGPIVVTGHSAGGHLAARMGQVGLEAPLAKRLQKLVPISPLGDLRPLLETTMNAELALDLAEARAESPALHPRAKGVAAHIWVGGYERPAFLDQARRLGNGWACPVTVEAGRHHFDVIDGLEDGHSPLMRVLLPEAAGPRI